MFVFWNNKSMSEDVCNPLKGKDIVLTPECIM